MQLKWRPNMIINRFGKVFKSDNNWFIESENKEELDIFKAYWFKEIINEEVNNKKIWKSKTSK